MQTSSGGDNENELALAEELSRLENLSSALQGANAGNHASSSIQPQLQADIGPSASTAPEQQGTQPIPIPLPPPGSRPSSSRPKPHARQAQLERTSLEHAPGPPGLQEAVEVLSANADTISRMLYPAGQAEQPPLLPEGDPLDQLQVMASPRNSNESQTYFKQTSRTSFGELHSHSILKQPGTLSRRASELRAAFKDLDPEIDALDDALRELQSANGSVSGVPRSAKSSENGTGILRSASSKRRASIRKLVFSADTDDPQTAQADELQGPGNPNGSAIGSTASSRHGSNSGAPPQGDGESKGLLVRIGSLLTKSGSINMFKLKRDNVEIPGDDIPPLRPAQSEHGALPKSDSINAADKGRSKSIDLERKQRSVLSLVSGALRKSVNGAQDSQVSLNQATSKQRRSSVASFFGRGTSAASDVPELSRQGSGRRGRSSMLSAGTLSASNKSRQHSMIDLINNLVTRNKSEEDEEYYFTNIHDFKPRKVMAKRTNCKQMYFVTAANTGITYILKKYDKDRMEAADDRRVRAALGISEQLCHPCLVPIRGNWETDDAIYIVEEYASKGDLLQDHLARANKYTEAYLAVHVIKPLLTVLAYLHSNKIVHRAVYPENIMFGRDDKLLLGSYGTMTDINTWEATDRSGFLDYMAPELVSVKDHEERSKLTPQTSLRRSLRRNQMAAAAAAVAQDPQVAAANSPILAQQGEHSSGQAVAEGMPLPFGHASSPRAAGTLASADAPVSSRSRLSEAPDVAMSQPSEVSRKSRKPVSKGVSYSDLHDVESGKGTSEVSAPASRSGIGIFGALASTFRRLNLDVDTGDERLSRVSRRVAGQEVMMGQVHIPVAHNPWEWQRYYDEKVDIWQVGCLVHEILCGTLPFEAEDRLLTAALILWADIQVFPNDLSPECISFMQACMTKNPRVRPSAEELLTHEWITRHDAGEILPTIGQLENSVLPPTTSILAAGNVFDMIKQALKNGKQVLSSVLRRHAGSGVGDEATRPGGITPVPRKVYMMQSLAEARGEVRRVHRSSTTG